MLEDMTTQDQVLTARISQSARRADIASLRRIVVGRLGDSQKAVARLSLRGATVSVFCETCLRWLPAPNNDFPIEWRCPACKRLYEMEFAILEEVVD